MTARRDFLRSVIGAPYAPGGCGPAYDCYGLARVAMQALYGRTLPDRSAPADRRSWRRASIPADGAVLLMGATADKHVGVYVAGGVLHAMEGLGVVHDDLASLRLRGFSRLRVYLPA